MKYYSSRKTKQKTIDSFYTRMNLNTMMQSKRSQTCDQILSTFNFTNFPEKASSETQIAGYLGSEVGIRVVIHWKQVEGISQEDRYVLTLNQEVAQLSRFTINIQCIFLMVAFYVMQMVPQGSWVKNALPVSYHIIYTPSKSKKFLFEVREPEQWFSKNVVETGSDAKTVPSLHLDGDCIAIVTG